jgi:TonB-dependent receptor
MLVLHTFLHRWIAAIAALAVAVFTCVSSHAQSEPAGAVRGIVYDRDFEVPLANVRVWIAEQRLTTLSSETGNFVFERVPAGVYTVTFTKPGYDREVRTGVVVIAGQMADLGRIDLAAEVIDMDELVVTGTDLLQDTEIGLLEIRAEALVVQDAISSELISKAGVSDVAGALKLVTGASVAEGKYATVRGLSDRYTGATLNGVRVPSADPRKRAVQIDLFPTGTVESVTVTKTFTPDLQGDFTGGGVDIKTKSIPDAYFLSVSLSTEHDQTATGSDEFLTYLGGGVDVTGFGGSDRELPAAARNLSLTKSFFEIDFERNPTPEDQEASDEFDRLTRSFAPAMGVMRDAPGINHGFSIVTGNRFDWGKRGLFGYVGALTYSRKYDLYLNGENNRGGVSSAEGPLNLGSPRTDSAGTDEVLLGGLLNFDWRPSDSHQFSLKLIGNQGAQDEARLQFLERPGFPGFRNVELNQSLKYVERSVASMQLHGHHETDRLAPGPFTGLHWDWVAAYNLTSQDEPDVRFYRNESFFADFDGDGDEDVSHFEPRNSQPRDVSRRIFREIEEGNAQAALNVSLPFNQWTETEGRVKVGLLHEQTDRDFSKRSFFWRFPQTSRFARGSTLEERAAVSCNQGLGQLIDDDPDALWTDIYTDPDNVGLSPDTVTCRVCENSLRPCFSDRECRGVDERCVVRTDLPNPSPNQLLWVLDPDFEQDVFYTGDQTIQAAYAMAELPLSPKLTLTAGARYESTEIAIDPEGALRKVVFVSGGGRTTERAQPDEARARIDESSVLPSVGLVYEIKPEMFVRASWSKTLARPTFRELAPVLNEEFIFGDEFLGTADLKLSSITNYDLRWEWFRRPGEVLAVSGFYKKIRDPIELLSFTLVSEEDRTIVNPTNFDEGEASGFEVEARSALDVVWKKLKNLTFGANYTVIDSEVTVPEDEQQRLAGAGLDEETRPLQGQPDFLLNANLTYDNDEQGTSLGIFYNHVGETLASGAAIGFDGTPDVFVDEFESLDVTFKQRIRAAAAETAGADFSLSVKLKNLLQDEKRRLYRLPRQRFDLATGEPFPLERIKSERETARRVSVSLSWKW